MGYGLVKLVIAAIDLMKSAICVAEADNLTCPGSYDSYSLN